MRLRKLRLEDADCILEWMHDEDVIKNFRLPDKVKNLEAVSNFINNSFTDQDKHFAIADAEDSYMGTISLKNIDYDKKTAEYAIVLNSKSIGKGFGKEATNLIFDYALNELELDSIYLNVLSHNQRAIEMYNKAGFSYIKSTLESLEDKELSLDWFEIKLK